MNFLIGVPNTEYTHCQVGRLGEAKVSCISHHRGIQRRRVSYVTEASNWYLLIVGQGLLSLQNVKVEGECFYFFCFFTFIHFSFSPVPLFHLLCCLLSLFSLSLGDNSKWPTGVDVSIHAIPHTVRQNLTEFSPFWTPFPIRFSNLTEFSYHLISCFLKNWK